ncbi:predicted protein [Chaetomium globosum CBS 148.51]|uniref:Uncharacterized protein n=1 Tax=Chaetomium globosum (strain ATCC 6205 / CBS 148.51 / DSM 1962 / NBRC 6347 / NRRL 1970) TaxID=306901 RepID=Q2H859_CHAGB|nr:uncharacterized protein CHGG_03595 [Chaetomium globosum CBS 148.51]EAQ91660.1 predicted protein [Chaetomium globosum CBS 148.51]
MASTTNNNDTTALETICRRAVADPSTWPPINNSDTTDMEALYRRAVADASSLTQGEINLIFGWVSPEEDEHICRTKANGKTRAELIAIAATNPEQLTRVESELVQRSVPFLIELRREAQNPNGSPPDMIEVIDRGQQFIALAQAKRKIPLYKEALQAVWNSLDDQERLAIIAAGEQSSQIMDEEWAEADRKTPRRIQQTDQVPEFSRD